MNVLGIFIIIAVGAVMLTQALIILTDAFDPCRRYSRNISENDSTENQANNFFLFTIKK